MATRLPRVPKPRARLIGATAQRMTGSIPVTCRTWLGGDLAKIARESRPRPSAIDNAGRLASLCIPSSLPLCLCPSLSLFFSLSLSLASPTSFPIFGVSCPSSSLPTLSLRPISIHPLARSPTRLSIHPPTHPSTHVVYIHTCMACDRHAVR
ncbi:hypothetical protein GGS23DRAFT_110226 [Durotheca rogersii]|uniref:uncharacterized protein n=1 Tax=Durotheca rogersii TaxID=419775 RepID=UPI00221FC3EB|nr:uncharacterized protein GGS23DRAFT_110226 [Durotheca rogersii]KAI5862181.1 hypothetical protein GGS23DRAFT_110226 [Durotheca rogersii]